MRRTKPRLLKDVDFGECSEAISANPPSRDRPGGELRRFDPKGEPVADKPELDDTGGRKKSTDRPDPSTAARAKEDPPQGHEIPKDGKANNKEQSGQRWWARWRS